MLKGNCLLFLSFYLIGSVQILGQKPAIINDTYKTWPEIEYPNISNDGKYASYTLKNQPKGSYTAIFCSTKGNWRKQIPGVEWSVFSGDSRFGVYLDNDSLVVLKLGTNKQVVISNVKVYDLFGINKEWLSYRLKSDHQKILFRHLNSGRELSFTSVENYNTRLSGNQVLLIKSGDKDNSQLLEIVNLDNGHVDTIWNGPQTYNHVVNDDGNLLAFITKDEKLVPGMSIWLYQKGMDGPVFLANEHIAGLGSDYILNSISKFSKDGSRLFITIKRLEKPTLKSYEVPVNVWSYNDPELQSRQKYRLSHPLMTGMQAAILISEHELIKLQHEDESLQILAHEHFALATGSRFNNEIIWNRLDSDTTFLISLVDGNRTPVYKDAKSSPGGMYLLYYDYEKSNYFTYDVVSGIIRNITGSIHTTWTTRGANHWGTGWIETGSTWANNDEFVILQDQYDLWQIDPRGILDPINLTNGYGRQRRISFQTLRGAFMSDFEGVFPNKGDVIITGFNRDTKENGFFRIAVGHQQDPEQLTMGSYTYWAPQKKGVSGYSMGRLPLPSADHSGYLVYRMSATESPNLFYTQDFKSFKKLSSLSPEKQYNWMVKELVTWNLPNGMTNQGILYKPENFDSNKKYPLIFHFYELLSDDLNGFVKPEPAGGRINIDWYVSNGYLVFEPDIWYEKGKTFESTYNTVISAANYLSQFPYVDGQKIGLQGHSWGGFQANYIVTHTDRFAAVCSAAGASDFVSNRGTISLGNGWIKEYDAQLRPPGTLWESPNWYFNNSPVLLAHKVATPILLMNNPLDGAVPYSQGVEFFTALRRLGKKAWMLEYDNGLHGLFGKQADDYTIRMQQFFGHYLKDAPAPKWMVEGIPAKLKGIESGLELEPAGVTPGPGLLKENN